VTHDYEYMKPSYCWEWADRTDVIWPWCMLTMAIPGV